MITDPLVQRSGNHLGRATTGAPDNRHDGEGGQDTEQPGDNLVNNVLNLTVASGGVIELKETGFMSEGEEVVLEGYEFEVLVVDLGDAVDGIGG